MGLWKWTRVFLGLLAVSALVVGMCSCALFMRTDVTGVWDGELNGANVHEATWYLTQIDDVVAGYVDVKYSQYSIQRFEIITGSVSGDNIQLFIESRWSDSGILFVESFTLKGTCLGNSMVGTAKYDVELGIAGSSRSEAVQRQLKDTSASPTEGWTWNWHANRRL